MTTRTGVSTLIGIMVFFVVAISIATSLVQYFDKISQELDRKALLANENLEILSVAFTANEMKIRVLNKGSTYVEVVRIWIKDSNGYYRFDETTNPSFHESIVSGETKLISLPYAWNGNEVVLKLVSGKGKTYPYTVANQTWWDNAWSYRKQIIIINSDGEELKDYQVLINVTYDESMQINFKDIRFTYRQGLSENEIPCCIQEKQDGKYALFWVKLPEIKAHTRYDEGNTSYSMYYGNAMAGNVSNPGSTFDFYSDYSENAWVYSSGFSPKGSRMNIDLARNGDKRATSKCMVSLSGNSVEGRTGFILYSAFLVNTTLSEENTAVYVGLFGDEVNSVNATQFMGLVFGANKTVYPYIRNEAHVFNYTYDPFKPSDGECYHFEIKRCGESFGLTVWTDNKDSPAYLKSIDGINLEGTCYSFIQISNYNDGASDSRFVGALSGFMYIRRYTSPEPIALLGPKEARE